VRISNERPDLRAIPIPEAARRAEAADARLAATAPADEAVVPLRLPDWVAGFGAFRRGGRIVVVCESGGPDGPGALVLDEPRGRYSVITIDERTGEALGMESAAGGPLVCTPPRGLGASIVFIERIAQAQGERR
jgi:hypothetical protein